MTISFAGVSLLLEDPRGEAARHVRRFLEWPMSTINAPPRRIDTKSRVQRPHWPDRPRLQPNQLYCPTGATRWAQFVGLATTAQKNAILAAVGRSGDGLLVMSVPGSPTVTVPADIPLIDGATFNLNQPTPLLSMTMYLLPPIPVSQMPNTLWIIPLVDVRYAWQTTLFTSSASTWSGLLTEIKTALGISINRDTATALDANYGSPDSCVFRNGAINAAAALDMLCWATNQRLAPVSVGTLSASTPAKWVLRSATPNDLYQLESTTQLTAAAGGCVAGGEWSQVKNYDVPSSVIWHFTNDGSSPHLTYTATPTVAWGVGSPMDVICPATSTGSNDAALEAMADKWTTDFLQWSKWRFSWTWNWLIDWHYTGYEDYCLYSVALTRHNTYQCRTFVKSLPPLAWGADLVPLQTSGGGNSCGTGGSTCNTVRFRIGAVITGTMSAICFIHAVDGGKTIADVPDLANLEFPGNPYPGTPNILVCDPLCMFFNEPAEGLTDRLGWAKYMQPLVPNTCQTDINYLVPQWEVFALNCVNNPSC